MKDKGKKIMKDNWKSPLFKELTLSQEESLSGGRCSVGRVRVANRNLCRIVSALNNIKLLAEIDFPIKSNSIIQQKGNIQQQGNIQQGNGGNQILNNNQTANGNIVGNG